MQTEPRCSRRRVDSRGIREKGPIAGGRLQRRRDVGRCCRDHIAVLRLGRVDQRHRGRCDVGRDCCDIDRIPQVGHQAVKVGENEQQVCQVGLGGGRGGIVLEVEKARVEGDMERHPGRWRASGGVCLFDVEIGGVINRIDILASGVNQRGESGRDLGNGGGRVARKGEGFTVHRYGVSRRGEHRGLWRQLHVADHRRSATSHHHVLRPRVLGKHRSGELVGDIRHREAVRYHLRQITVEAPQLRENGVVGKDARGAEALARHRRGFLGYADIDVLIDC